ncbi:unnamed protein product [Dicrocoelium dendriticum]|nr:unnamed protein product [Dicrocoelium dendriticum]
MQRLLQKFPLEGLLVYYRSSVWLCGICARGQGTLAAHVNIVDPPSERLVPLIGLEVHAQLVSCTKLFSRTPYSFGSPPNTQLSLLDAAIPGSLPLLNRRCVEAALFIAFALNSRINLQSQFDRKHYFYSDSPAGYQITQYFHPIAEGGYLDYLWSPDSGELPAVRLADNGVNLSLVPSRAHIKRVQLEQDTGKSLHDEERRQSLIDLNRSGVALVELVTEPDFTNSSQVAAFIKELSTVLSFIGSCSANASLGELRVDVNVSVGPSRTEQGPRTEVKNVNSVRGVANAIDYEIRRQTELIGLHGTVGSETRFYDPVQKCTLPMRDKQSALDYRYLPEPNLPPLRLASFCLSCRNEVDSTDSSGGSERGIPNPYTPFCLHCARKRYIQHVETNGMGELPNATRQRLSLDYSLPWHQVCVLVENPSLRRLFDTCRELMTGPQYTRSSSTNACQELGYWISGQLHGMSKRGEMVRLPSPQQLVEFVDLNLTGRLHGESAVKLLCLLTSGDTLASQSCLQLATDRDWLSINDPKVMRASCARVVNDCPKALGLFQNGHEKKAVKRLIQSLLNNAAYRASKFHPIVLRDVLLDELRSRSAQKPTGIH